MSANIPAVVEKHLDAIHCTSDGRIILASSNLTGRYWNGSLWLFPSVEDAPHVEKCVTGIDVSSGISDMKSLNKDFVVLGLDSGCLEVHKLYSDPASFSCVLGITEHDDYITSLSLNSEKNSLITAGADKCVKIWDVGSWATSATYRPVHGGIIWQVACSTEDPSVFLTCGQDGKILLFDLRLPKPASAIDTSSLMDEPTALAWKPGSTSSYVVGDASGLVAIKDSRIAGTVCSWTPHKRRIGRLSFSESKPWLASIADDTNVCITDVEVDTPVKIYENNDHQDFVRDLTWNEKNELITCGWDKNIIKHICAKEGSS